MADYFAQNATWDLKKDAPTYLNRYGLQYRKSSFTYSTNDIVMYFADDFMSKLQIKHPHIMHSR